MPTEKPFLAGNLRIRWLWLVFGWLLILFVVYQSLTPVPLELEFEQGDKISHVVAYLVLMIWFANLYHSLGQRVCLALGFLVLGITLEFLQHWTGYGSFEIADMAAGAVGIAIGWIAAPPRTPNFLSAAEKFWQAR